VNRTGFNYLSHKSIKEVIFIMKFSRLLAATIGTLESSPWRRLLGLPKMGSQMKR
jgi:hypothetical protein